MQTTGEIYSVSQLNREVRSLLEGSFPMIWIEGEISNLARPGSGHVYFSLKDSQSQVRCAMFRAKCTLLRFQPENGMQVLIFARVSLYEGRGEFQLIAERMEPSGEGALQLAFEQLKQRLDKEGLFDPSHKKSLPDFPHTVGVVTSPTGAAIRDILSVLQRRFPALQVIIYPTRVQGEGAGQSVARMIRLAAERQECDVLIVSRGGGSLEDLWSFNEEAVARAIYACEIPVVVGVGHEIDFTIADFVADVRAPTPSAAAELISQDQDIIMQHMMSCENWMIDRIKSKLSQLQQAISWLEKRLISPARRLEDLAQRLDELGFRMNAAMRAVINQGRLDLSQKAGDLRHHNPIRLIGSHLERCHQLRQRLDSTMTRRLERLNAKLAETGRALHAVSPLATLDRGYAIIETEPERFIVRCADQVNIGDRIRARLAVGAISCLVEDRHLEDKSGNEN